MKWKQHTSYRDTCICVCVCVCVCVRACTCTFVNTHTPPGSKRMSLIGIHCCFQQHTPRPQSIQLQMVNTNHYKLCTELCKQHTGTGQTVNSQTFLILTIITKLKYDCQSYSTSLIKISFLPDNTGK
jgi:hypothetical protein